MNIKILKEKGQSLIEVLAVLSISITVISAMTASVITALSTAQRGKNQNIASQYAQEGTEVMRRMRQAGQFSQLATGTYCLAASCDSLSSSNSSCWVKPTGQAHCPVNVEKFIREITVEQNSPSCEPPTPATGPPVSPVSNTKVTVSALWNDSQCVPGTFCENSSIVSCLSDTGIGAVAPETIIVTTIVPTQAGAPPPPPPPPPSPAPTILITATPAPVPTATPVPPTPTPAYWEYPRDFSSIQGGNNLNYYGYFSNYSLMSWDSANSRWQYNPFGAYEWISRDYLHPYCTQCDSIVRWTAPQSGTFSLSGSFTQVDACSSDSYIDYFISKNGVFSYSLPNNNIWTARSIATWTNNVSPFNLNISVITGDKIEFAVVAGTYDCGRASLNYSIH